MTSAAQTQAPGNGALERAELTLSLRAIQAHLTQGAMPRCMTCPRKVRGGPWRLIRHERIVDGLRYELVFSVQACSSLGGETYSAWHVELEAERADLAAVVLYMRSALLSREHVDYVIANAMPRVIQSFAQHVMTEELVQVGGTGTGGDRFVHALRSDGRPRCSAASKRVQLVLPMSGGQKSPTGCNLCFASMFRQSNGLDALSRAFVQLAQIDGTTILGRCARCEEEGR